MGKDSEFYKDKKKAQTIRLRELLIQLPPCAVDYIHSKEVTSQVSTLVQYSYDLITFFTFMKDQNPVFRNKDPKEISVDLISKISPEDILEYQRYLELNVDRNHYHENGKKAIARKMSPLRGMFKFLLVYKKIKENPMELVPLPRLKKDKNIIRMNAAEVQSMMNTAEYGAGTMSDRQRKFAEKTKFRDVAILTLMLNTGIRVSECNGLDLNDVDLNANTLTIVRKGGAQDLLYFGDPVHDAISDYLELERKGIQVREGHEKAMFLSLQGKRISVDAIENLVKKYAKIAVPNKKITPHKLRSTYGTALYRETGDIRLVADVLGHENINTTIDYYAAIEDEHKRQARNAVDYKKMNKDQ
ncbi:MAG: tyrosine-type recombinase/integrase [Lachnospiraceae bacterium]|nr:tyrosine-type recombinase/integrase [Lachnospiraceae bacterium]